MEMVIETINKFYKLIDLATLENVKECIKLVEKINGIYRDAVFRNEYEIKKLDGLSYENLSSRYMNLDEIEKQEEQIAYLLLAAEKLEKIRFDLPEMLKKADHNSWINLCDALDYMFEEYA